MPTVQASVELTLDHLVAAAKQLSPDELRELGRRLAEWQTRYAPVEATSLIEPQRQHETQLGSISDHEGEEKAWVQSRVTRSTLNPEYSFDKFTVGPNNRFAHAVSLAVAENPNAKVYNPLLIYGGAGLGKTHILHAIANHITAHRPALRVLYVPSEQFMNDMNTATSQTLPSNLVECSTMQRFREKYRSIDVLLIDDIQFLQSEPGAQEEFFHTLNDLHAADKQTILTSDSPPDQMPAFEDRLKSRFERGMITRIDPPDLETRIAILQERAKDYNLSDLPRGVAFAIADCVRTNIRTLEGSLQHLIRYAKSNDTELTVNLACELLKNIAPEDVEHN